MASKFEQYLEILNAKQREAEHHQNSSSPLRTKQYLKGSINSSQNTL